MYIYIYKYYIYILICNTFTHTHMLSKLVTSKGPTTPLSSSPLPAEAQTSQGFVWIVRWCRRDCESLRQWQWVFLGVAEVLKRSSNGDFVGISPIEW